MLPPYVFEYVETRLCNDFALDMRSTLPVILNLQAVPWYDASGTTVT